MPLTITWSHHAGKRQPFLVVGKPHRGNTGCSTGGSRRRPCVASDPTGSLLWLGCLGPNFSATTKASSRSEDRADI